MQLTLSPSVETALIGWLIDWLCFYLWVQYFVFVQKVCKVFVAECAGDLSVVLWRNCSDWLASDCKREGGGRSFSLSYHPSHHHPLIIILFIIIPQLIITISTVIPSAITFYAIIFFSSIILRSGSFIFYTMITPFQNHDDMIIHMMIIWMRMPGQFDG